MAAINHATMTDPDAKISSATDYSNLLQTHHSDTFAFSEQEDLALKLYDQLRELELQRSLIKSHNETHAPNVSALSDDAVQEQLIKAEREALEAKAKYELRNRITQNVLVMDPVLKAVHGGEHTGYAEKRILPLITERDVVSMVHGSLNSRLTTITDALSEAEKGNIEANKINRELAQTLLALAEDLKAQSTEDIGDPNLRNRVKAVEKDVKDSRRKMKILKGVLAGMIVGSGMNWAEDEVLRELVMDDEEDG
ncbi:centromere protein H (CENP-H)-domain-containing protein [Lophiotrema nucula]|uniref:Centromere protein H (CENP-H)-domain-containing protein n=1 Tax=Lophiotrema nucula TaxID=690887 RepID=A0A6A5YMG1_9PLEO|nr:centromere protein H (CENP-H)-domain-containing protein [Lophiotrema nucula]